MDGNINSYMLLVAIIAGLGGFLFGFDSSVIADVQDQIIRQLSLNSWEWSLVVSFSLLGSVAGIPLSGYLSDQISRKTLLKTVAIGFILGTACCALANTLNYLLLGRFIIGVCIGIASYIAPLFIAEISPPKNRGALVLINGLALTFGQAVAYLIGYLLHDSAASSWRLILWTGIIPALLLFIGMLFVPHSPRWLVKKQGLEKAVIALKKIRPEGADLSSEIAEIKNNSSPLKQSKTLLLSKPFLSVLAVGTLLGVFQQFSGINALMYYGPMIFQSAGFLSIQTAILATFVIGVVNFIFTAFTLCFVDRFGRRFLLLNGMMLASLSLFAISLCFNRISPAIILLLFCTYVMGYCVSVGSLFWVLISEIFPQATRGFAMSIATVIQWLANFLVSVSFLAFFTNTGPSLTFSLYGGFCLLAFFFIYYFIPETSGVSLEKIEDNLLKGHKIRDLGQNLNKQKNKLALNWEVSNE
ncbi:MFS transporter [Legionella quinlivanii]|uniref:MFS transporter n=1 Tax=Legionella quinlivanii TaxID=45073 RepID=A0A364LMB4_9GAMM|nr:sugar porter family MFS transporter [Legionella quinlivanii]RAP38018.1 MFS transporter [Legionella quinlivanii]